MAFRSLRHTLAALLLLLSLASGAAAAVQVRVMPAVSSGAVGSTVTVTVEADSVSNLGGFQFGFTYSNADLQVVSTTINPAFDQVVAQDLGAATGSGMIAATVFNNPPLSGTPVTLATLNFRILTPSSGSVTLSGVILGQVGGAEIPSTGVGGTVSGISTGTVVFASNGGSAVPSQIVAYNSVASVPAAPARTGYTFVGWYADPGLTAPYAFTTPITANTTLYASWTVNPANGQCGTSNGGTFRVAPATGLCSPEAAVSLVQTAAGWNWSCPGANGGSSASCSAVIDITGPALTISTLADGAITNNATLNVSGTVADASGVAGMTINNVPVAVTSGSFSYPVTLQNGPNTITTVAADTLGNSTTDSRIITLDNTAPVLTVSAPADNSATAQGVATITGTINKASTVTITVTNGTSQNAAITGSAFSATVNLAVGLNTATITATDLANNTTSAVRSITYDNTNPSLAITNPGQDITTAQNSIAVSGTVSDAITSAAVVLTFNNQSYTPAITNGAFSQELTIPAEGTYAITATATDAAGNNSSATRNVIYALPENGTCGSSNGGTFTTAPTANLCSKGTAAPVTGSGPWNWSCGGSNGGSTATCSAGTQVSAVDTIPPVITDFAIPAMAANMMVPVTTFTATDSVGVTGYLLTESATPPTGTDPEWSATAPATYICETWGNISLHAYAKDAAGNISAAKATTLFIGTDPIVDGVMVPGPGKSAPRLEDALMSLNFAMKVGTPTATELLHGKVAPLVNGVPQPDPNRLELNLGDTIVILRRVLGL